MTTVYKDERDDVGHVADQPVTERLSPRIKSPRSPRAIGSPSPLNSPSHAEQLKKRKSSTVLSPPYMTPKRMTSPIHSPKNPGSRVVSPATSPRGAIEKKKSIIRPPSVKGLPFPSTDTSKDISTEGSMYAQTHADQSNVHWVQMVQVSMYEPLVKMRFYNHGDFGSDCVTFFHNGIKREIQDIYYMMSSMMKRQSHLRVLEFNQFYIWFDTFTEILNRYFQYEESQLIPFIQRVSKRCDEALDPQDMEIHAAKQRTIEVELVKVHDFPESILARGDVVIVGNLPVSQEFLQDMICRMDAFAEALLDYLFFEEKVFIPLVSGRVTKIERIQFESEVFRALHNAGVDGHVMFHILLRPLKSLEKREAKLTRERYLNQYSTFSYKNAKVRKQYLQSREAYRANHTRILTAFCVRWNRASQYAARYEFHDLGSPYSFDGYCEWADDDFTGNAQENANTSNNMPLSLSAQDLYQGTEQEDTNQAPSSAPVLHTKTTSRGILDKLIRGSRGASADSENV
mmetsp:Transcript_21450/g.36881  ORF Transcript_21450/g.36881 Transcript_21450/m.36881 type:complete len:514 (+) Transcript_21450:85-1626(+)